MDPVRDPAKRDSDRERSEVLVALCFMVSLLLEQAYESGKPFPKEGDLEDFGRADYLVRKFLRRRQKEVINAPSSNKRP